MGFFLVGKIKKMNSLDIFINNYLSFARTSSLTGFFYLVTTLFDLSVFFVAIVLFIMFLVYLVRDIKYSLLFGFVLVANSFIVYVLKYLFDVERPTQSLAIYFGQSFPSYHAMIATTFFVLLIYIFDDYFSKIPRLVFNFICIASIFLVSISRVYLGAHWVSDVFFGVVIGSVSTYIFIKIFKYVTNRLVVTSVIK